MTAVPAARQGALPSALLDPVLMALIEIIRDGLLRDGMVRLSQFGTFRLRQVKAHRIKHPLTGELMESPAHARVVFVPAKALREQIEPHPKPIMQIAADNAPPQPLPAATPPAVTVLVEDAAQLQRPPQPLFKLQGRGWWLPVAAIPLLLIGLNAGFSPGLRPVPVEAGVVPARVPSVADTRPAVDLPRPVTAAASEAVPSPSLPSVSRPVMDPPRAAATPSQAAAIMVAASSAPTTGQSTNYQIQSGDSLWNLAKHRYGDPLLWPLIYRANLDRLRHPDRLSTGLQLVLPALAQPQPPYGRQDRRLIAEGYFLVYRYYLERGVANGYYFLIAARDYDPAWIHEQRPQVAASHWHLLD